MPGNGFFAILVSIPLDTGIFFGFGFVRISDIWSGWGTTTNAARPRQDGRAEGNGK
jgi:hypothetical protein